MNPSKELKEVAKIPIEERSEEEKRFAAKKFKEWRMKASLNGIGVREICQDAEWIPLFGVGQYDELAKVAVAILNELNSPPEYPDLST
ncbi:hypothetical protein BGZ94_006639 [Podila epigama]|nr:hypothetical protein BGZ94_006639 [Podila epigama]